MKVHIFSYPEFVLEIPNPSLPEVLDVAELASCTPPCESPNTKLEPQDSEDGEPSHTKRVKLKEQEKKPFASSSSFGVDGASDTYWREVARSTPLKKRVLLEIQRELYTVLSSEVRYKLHYTYLPLPDARGVPSTSGSEVKTETSYEEKWEQQHTIEGQLSPLSTSAAASAGGGAFGSTVAQEIPLYGSVAADPWTLLQRVQQVKQYQNGLTDPSSIALLHRHETLYARHGSSPAGSSSSTPTTAAAWEQTTHPMWWSPTLLTATPSSSLLTTTGGEGGRVGPRSRTTTPASIGTGTSLVAPPPAPAGLVFVSETKQLPIPLVHSNLPIFTTGTTTTSAAGEDLTSSEEEVEEEGEESIEKSGVVSYFELVQKRGEGRWRSSPEERTGNTIKEEMKEEATEKSREGGDKKSTMRSPPSSKKKQTVSVGIPCMAELSYVGYQWWKQYSTSSPPPSAASSSMNSTTSSSSGAGAAGGASLFFATDEQEKAETLYFSQHHYRTLYLTDSRVAAELFLLCLRAGSIALPFRAKLYAFYRPKAKLMRSMDYGKLLHPNTVAPQTLLKKLDTLRLRANLDEDLWTALTEGLHGLRALSRDPFSSSSTTSSRSGVMKGSNNPPSSLARRDGGQGRVEAKKGETAWTHVQDVYRRVYEEQQQQYTPTAGRTGRPNAGGDGGLQGARSSNLSSSSMSSSVTSVSAVLAALSSPSVMHDRHVACALRFAEEYISYVGVLNEEEEASSFLVGMGLFFPQALTLSSSSSSTRIREGTASLFSLPFPGLSEAPLTLEDLLTCFISHSSRRTLVQALGLFIARYIVPPEELPLFFFQAFSESGMLPVGCGGGEGEGGGGSRIENSSSRSSVSLQELATMLWEEDEVQEAWLPSIDELWRQGVLVPAMRFFQRFWGEKKKTWMREVMRITSDAPLDDDDEEDDEAGVEEKRKNADGTPSPTSREGKTSTTSMSTRTPRGRRAMGSPRADASLGLLAMVFSQLRVANERLRRTGLFSHESGRATGWAGAKGDQEKGRKDRRVDLSGEERGPKATGKGVGAFGFRSIRDLAQHTLENEQQAITASKVKSITSLLSSRWIWEGGPPLETTSTMSATRQKHQTKEGEEDGEALSLTSLLTGVSGDGNDIFPSSVFTHAKRTRGGQPKGGGGTSVGLDGEEDQEEDDDDGFLLRVQVASEEHTGMRNEGLPQQLQHSLGKSVSTREEKKTHASSSSVRSSVTSAEKGSSASSSAVATARTVAMLHREVQVHGYALLMSLLRRRKRYDPQDEHFIEF